MAISWGCVACGLPPSREFPAQEFYFYLFPLKDLFIYLGGRRSRGESIQQTPRTLEHRT